MAALVLAPVVSMVSCVGAVALSGRASPEPSAVESALRFFGPFVVGALAGASVFYVLLAGGGPELRKRRTKRVARARLVPSPLAMGALTLVVVLGACVTWIVSLPPLGGFEGVAALLAIGSSLILASLLALFVGIATARVRARQKAEELDTDDSTSTRVHGEAT